MGIFADLRAAATPNVQKPIQDQNDRLLARKVQEFHNLQVPGDTPLKAAPPKADAAPSGQTIMAFTGLCDALNQFQKDLVKAGTYSVPDEYVIQFAPETMASSTVALDGQAYKSSPSNNAKTPNAQLNPAAQQMATTGRIVPVQAGTQIIAFIDQVMRSSSFITDQANVIIDETTKQLKPNPKAGPNNDIMWYKISFQAVQLQRDEKRNDYAYRMIYTVSPYAINQLDSEYFNQSRFRGVHKDYNYWFTGENNSVIQFEREHDQTYRTILTLTDNGEGIGELKGLKNLKKDPTLQAQQNTDQTGISKTFAAATGINSQGANWDANKIGASAADYLYSIAQHGSLTMRIVGDPAWIAQGEVTNSVNASTLRFDPFTSDGTINYDASQVLFRLNFNRPADYDFNTGVVDVNAQTFNPNGSTAALQPQAHIICTAKEVKSFFNNGKFEQEIQGLIYSDLFNATTAAAQEQPAVEDQNKKVTTTKPATNPNSNGKVTPAQASYNKWIDPAGISAPKLTPQQQITKTVANDLGSKALGLSNAPITPGQFLTQKIKKEE